MANSNSKKIKSLESEILYAASLALNDTANALESSLNEATSKFDGGSTKFTQKAFTVSQQAKKGVLEAHVTARPIQDAYLSKAFDGGIRRPGDPATGDSTIVLPGASAKTNTQGNLARGYTKRQEPQIGSSEKPGKLFMGSVTSRHGKTLEGIFKREITQRRTNSRPQQQRLKALVLFQKEVQHDPARDFKAAFSDAVSNVPMNVFSDVMRQRMAEIEQHGRVLKKSERR